MCLADRIKSATPSIKGPKEVYLKREKGFFREFVSLGQLFIRKMFSCFTTPIPTGDRSVYDFLKHKMALDEFRQKT